LNNAKKNKFALDNHLRPQTDFIDGGVEVFKLEDGLEQLTQRLKKFLTLPANLSFTQDNIGNRSEVHWSNEALNLATDFYKNDFSQLNYDIRLTDIYFSKTRNKLKPT
jgi:hypothetical protein